MRISRRQRYFIICLGIMAGALSGVSAFTFFYAHGGSYLTDDPRACANCHVMQQQYQSWLSSSHHNVATCNDCHTPHNLVGKYYTKGLNGYHHSLAFTLGNFHEPIEIKSRNRGITQQACRSCHADIVQMIDHSALPNTKSNALGIQSKHSTEPVDCLRCHQSVGHME